MPRTPEELRKHRLIGHLRGDAARPADWQFRQGDGTRIASPAAWRCRSTPSMR